MRTDLVSPGVGEMTYEIRNIVNVAEKLQKCGVKINWENIGDPIVKGEQIPHWMKEIVAAEAMNNDTWGYCPTRGLLETREFICELTNKREGVKISPDDIIFFNGLGDAIAKIYNSLDSATRVLVPSPTYTTHTLAESANAAALPICYRLKAEDNWYPDMDEMRRQIMQNPCIAAIMLINPDNPTGMVYPKETLEKIVALAKEFDLFIISDEVYINIVYNGQSTVPISDVIGDVPAIALKGISKEFPWPGSRCGWIEIYNFDKDAEFQKYVNVILTKKMNEVCSTTLPQKCIPPIMRHPQYPVYLEERISRYEKMSNITYGFLKDIPGLVVNRTNGAFYMSVSFEEGMLTGRHTLPIDKLEVRELVERLVSGANISHDKRFVYYILAATGICVVPLSSFNTSLLGFRVTLLDRDEKECRRIYGLLAETIREYLAS